MSALTLNPLIVEPAVRAALAEDLGRAGDITTQATIPAGTRAVAVMAARKAGVVSGIEVARTVFGIVDSGLSFEILSEDGTHVAAGTKLARISGDARSILTAERVALNFACRMSGIATATARLATLIAHTKASVCDTRKTTPLLRAFEKHAVRCGGGMNHRFGLDDAVLIKDNHIAVAGGIAAALRAAKAHAGHLVKIEIEVDNLKQLEEVIAEGADVVLFDNMSNEDMAKGVAMVAGRMRIEASGGVDASSIKAIAETGVDLISSGGLTHSSPILDIGLDIEIG